MSKEWATKTRTHHELLGEVELLLHFHQRISLGRVLILGQRVALPLELAVGDKVILVGGPLCCKTQ